MDRRFRLVARFCLVQWFVGSAALAATNDLRFPEKESSATPTAPAAVVGRSPVEFFRELLAAPPAERASRLVIYPPGRQELIVAKLQEYQLLPPGLREQRLLVTELQWYLRPLLNTPGTNRAVQLAAIPEPARSLVKERIDIWDITPTPLRAEVLDYEAMMRLFLLPNGLPRPEPVLEDVPESSRPELEQKLAHWQSLPSEQRQNMYKRFQQFFGLTQQEKQSTLEVLSHEEREIAARTVEEFEKKPREQREQYIAALQKLEKMTPAELQQFSKSAAQWEKMPPAERQACRALMKRLSQFPPLPSGLILRRQFPAATGFPLPAKTNPTAAPVK